jgi:8-oxo-dGTP diphosphatase
MRPGKESWDVGAGGVVVEQDQVLMVRKAYGEEKGKWEIPGGYVNHTERLDEAAIREVREETSIEAEVVDIIGVRSRYDEQGGSVFVIFRMVPLTSEPVPDGVEVDQAKYFTVADIADMGADQITALSRSSALVALNARTGLVGVGDNTLNRETYKAFFL